MSQGPIAVVGMHRSGTSCLTGCLEDLGLQLNVVNRSAPYNAKGNNENEALRDLHDQVLARHGAAWDVPPIGPIDWTEDEQAMLGRFVADYEAIADGRPWGFKDPRSLLLLDGWFDSRPDLQLAGTFRHPLDVAASLNARSGMSIDQGLGLWRAYNERMLAWRERVDFPLVRYDQPVGHYRAAVQRMANRLGLSSTAEIHFLDRQLTHHASPEEAVPVELVSLWSRLVGWAEEN